MSSREEMIRGIRKGYGLESPEVLSVILQIPRERFVSEKYRSLAYEDRPVDIGFGQTISQPYTVAFMTHLLIGNDPALPKALRGKVLEIGTGSGYQAAVLAKLFRGVYSIEVIPQLAKRAKKTLIELGYKNIKVKTGSGEAGWKEYAPYDAIIITADIKDRVPKELIRQLKEGGVLVAPVNGRMKRMKKLESGATKAEDFGEFNFVPFV